MATVARSTNELFWGQAYILTALQGTQPTEELGHTRDALTIAMSRTFGEDRVQELGGPVQKRVIEESCMISGSIAQLNVSALERALGRSATTRRIPLGGGLTNAPELSVRAVGTRNDKSPIHLYFVRAIASNETIEMSFSKEEPGNVAFQFDWLDDSNGGSHLILGSAVEPETLSTGAAARTQTTGGDAITWLVLTSESSTADDFTDITAAGGSGALVNGEIARVQPAAGHAITVKHASGVIETKTGADFVMNNPNDWIDFHYDLAGTVWKEIVRYDAP